LKTQGNRGVGQTPSFQRKRKGVGQSQQRERGEKKADVKPRKMPMSLAEQPKMNTLVPRKGKRAPCPP